MVVASASTRGAMCFLSGVWVSKWHPTVLAWCLGDRRSMIRVVCSAGCPPVVHSYKACVADKPWSRPYPASANCVCPSVAQFTIANQDFANIVDHRVGVILCGNQLRTADKVVAVGACRDVFIVGGVIIGGVMHRSRGGVIGVNLILVWSCWMCRHYPGPVARSRVPKEGYVVIGAMVLLPWERYPWWWRWWRPLLCWSHPS